MKKGVRESIIHILKGGPTSTTSLVARVSALTKTSPQAVYKTISLLKNESVITVFKKITSLSVIYIEKERDSWNFVRFLYANKNLPHEKLNSDKSKLKLSFKSLKELDLFWTHSYSLLAETVRKEAIRYMLIPHDFFLYALPETDSFWVKKNIEPAEKSRLIVPYALPLDKETTRLRKNKGKTNFDFLLNKNPLKQKENEYINILGEYIFMAIFDKSIHDKIITYISKNRKIPINESELQEIRDFIGQKGKYILTIERNKKKAEMMEKKLKKYFE